MSSASRALSLWQPHDFMYMRQALKLAQQGALMGEVPVGAVLVFDNQVIGTGFNQPIALSDPSAHAEIVALRDACQQLDNYRLPLNTTLYVTLEPCTMCVGALIHARVSQLVFATHEPRAGMVGSQMNLTSQDFYNHRIQVRAGLLAKDSQILLKQFFKQRRALHAITKKHKSSALECRKA
ncbi:tRNA adenosine(34) deaminase TadA [Psychrobacter sp. I-STPA6b]|uniref:tRNA adenosine(34) deaminase TadA n=1 Tax=Psychrobacter sp. I-STPA6b TaxID=2585718 RepID=UPI001D0BFABA|nr:tRNA adenosine(34) deaminase TadA [Psychrobacter sp. I-STPA6b]